MGRCGIVESVLEWVGRKPAGGNEPLVTRYLIGDHGDAALAWWAKTRSNSVGSALEFV